MCITSGEAGGLNNQPRRVLNVTENISHPSLPYVLPAAIAVQFYNTLFHVSGGYDELESCPLFFYEFIHKYIIHIKNFNDVYTLSESRNINVTKIYRAINNLITLHIKYYSISCRRNFMLDI